MPKHTLTVDDIDKILPQTQCGLCDYGACRPYAQAIISDNETIDRCPPGGVKVLTLLGEMTGVDPSPFIPDMTQKAKPAQKVVVREDECIGCTKCIQACPVDAILGASKKMHTVIADECTGCELCIEPCPMDCIDIIPTSPLDDPAQLEFSNKNRKRYLAREQRLERIANEKKAKHNKAKIGVSDKQAILSARRAAIAQAVARSKAKKENQQ